MLSSQHASQLPIGAVIHQRGRHLPELIVTGAPRVEGKMVKVPIQWSTDRSAHECQFRKTTLLRVTLP